MRGGLGGEKTSLTPPLFIEVIVPSQESDRSCISVLSVSILLVSTILIFDFRIVVFLWVFFFFHFMSIKNKQRNTTTSEHFQKLTGKS